MKKFLTFLTLLTLFFTTAWAETVTCTLAGVDPDLSSQIMSGITWDYSITWKTESPGKQNVDGTKGAQIGTSKKPARSVVFSTTGISGTITSVKVNASTASSATATLSVSVGGVTYDTQNLTSSAADYTFSGTKSGEIVVTMNQPSTDKALYLKYIEVTYTTGQVTPTCAQPTISGTTPFDGSTTVTISCSDPADADIYYTTDGTDPDNNSTHYEGPFTLDHSATVKAIAYGTNYDPSPIANKAFVKTPSAATVAEILQLDNNTTFKFTGSLVVSGKSGNQLYAQDATGGMHFYGSTPAYDFGDVIPAGFVARFVADYNGAPELDNMSGMVAATETAELDAETLTPSQITTNNENAFIYAVIKNATIANNTITANGQTVTVQNTFNVTLPTDGKSYDFYGITNWNNGGRFIPLSFEEAYIDPGEGYFIVGNFCNWKKFAGYKLTEQDGKLVLDANLPAPTDINYGLQFKVVYAQNEQDDVWLGAQADGAWYGIDRDHTSVTLVNGSNLRIAAGGQTHFEVTINGDTKTLTVSRNAQAYFKCDKINNWAKEAMTATDNGWTITEQLEAGAKFGFEDEWGTHRGNDWLIKPEHYGDDYNIPLGNENTPTMQDAGYYKLDVNSALTVMHVNKEFAINCSADPNGGGNVTAKVGGQTATSAMAGETVTIEYTTANGYTFNNITLNDNVLDPVEGVYSFVMPNQDATVVANFTAQSFAITVVSPNGTTTCPETATTGSPVSFTVTPDEGYTVTNVTASFVNGENTGTVDVSYNEETGKYSFGMPPFPVTVTVTYKAPPAPITIPFVETWDGTEGVGGNDGDWAGINPQGVIVSVYEGWEYVNEGGAYKCVKLGTGKKGGSATTPEIVVTNGDTYKMTFRAGAWDGNSEGTTLSLSAVGATLYSDAECTTPLEEVTTVKGEWNTYTVYVKATAANMNITWYTSAGNNRFFLDDVNIDYITESKTLAQIVQLGAEADGKVYTISDADGLLGVYKSGNTVWFKDEVEKTFTLQNETLTIMGGSVYLDEPNDLQNCWIAWYEGENKREMRSKDFDQSNWIEVVFPEGLLPDEGVDGNEPMVHIKNLTGTFTNVNGLPKLVVTIKPTEVTPLTQADGLGYIPNRYMAANFEGSQNGYFLSTPKPQEYAYIIDAVWDGVNKVMVMSTDNDVNPEGFSGSFTIDPNTAGLVNGNYYSFHCIIRKAGVAKANAPRIKAVGDYDVEATETLSGSQTPTAISTIGVNGEVKSVKYVNVAGMVSDRPFQGVNIVVTEYTDGSRTTAKMVR